MIISPTKEITVVLGSGRSGTSILTRALHTLGCSLGDKLVFPDSKNPKGFFEDIQIVFEINEQIIARLGFIWHSLKAFNLPPFLDLADKAESILTAKFNEASWCAFKDPRTSRLLPFWQPIFSKMALKESYILALRNPLSSVASFEKYDNINRHKGYLVWLMHVIPAIERTLEKNTLVVSYEEMLADPKKQLERIHTRLNVAKPLEEASIAEYTHDFLDINLFRNQYSYEEFIGDSAAPFICIQLYDLLKEVAVDKISFSSTEFKMRWLKILSDYNNFLENFSSACLGLDAIPASEQNLREQVRRQKETISQLNEQLSQKAQSIDSLLSSHSWRLTAPLRKISSYLGKK